MLASRKIGKAPGPNGDFAALKDLLDPHLRALREYLDGQAERFEPEIRDLVRYCLTSGGKRIRASLVFLGGWRDAGLVSEDHIRAAAVVELVHLATLIHDDILDSAATRHNRPTAARAYGPHTAVLLGDAIFSQAVHLSTRFPTTEVCHRVSLATRRVCVGEITQTLRSEKDRFDLEDYWRVVDLKTAELFAVSAFLGAKLADYPEEFAEAAGAFGRHLGVAYQVYDDLVDFFGREEKAGKTLGTDLDSGRLTLPLLLLQAKLGSNSEECSGGTDGPDGKRVRAEQMLHHGVFQEVVDWVHSEIEQAEKVLRPYREFPPASRLAQVSELLKGQMAALEADNAARVTT